MSGNEWIHFQDTSKVYPNGTIALSRVNVRIQKGEWVAVMGPSGSGKTTFLHLIAGLDKPTSGAIFVNGIPVHELQGDEALEYRRTHIGIVFQQFHLLPYLTALENVLLAQYFHSETDEDEARELLERLGLGNRLHHYPSQLSGGEQQRVALARAVINDPPILLADEPTGNLDEDSEKEVLNILHEFHKAGKTIILVTHDPEVARFAQRLIYLEHGHLVTSHLQHERIFPLIDELLETAWKCEEKNEPLTEKTILQFSPLITRHVIDQALEKGFITIKDDSIELTDSGRGRAEILVRRHRLAEYLMMRIVGLDAERAQETACQFEHILSYEATRAICTFLKHPRTCPHGHRIPPGDCCQIPQEHHTVERSESIR